MLVVQLQERLSAEPRHCTAVVTGHSTPAVEDVGGASLRIAMSLASEHRLDPGGWLFGIRRAGTDQSRVASSFLPAIACVPGEHADRGGQVHQAYEGGAALAIRVCLTDLHIL